MSSKLSRYADGVMEAAWLAALVAVPLFFNVYSSRIFEPDKLSILRTLALVTLGAWVIKVLEEGLPQLEKRDPLDSRFRTLLRVPIVAPVLALAAVYLVSTLFSVAPRLSLLGSYQRLQGTYTTFSYLVIFAAIAVNLRRRAQVERLITVAILVSLPVSMYGVLQRYEIDPVPWAGNVTRRIASNMGNAIFVGAYLIMVVPLTIGRIVESFSAIVREDEEARGMAGHFIRATIYVFIAALQLIAIYLSRSRGPLLGLLAALFFLFILLSLHWRRRWMTFSIIGVAVLVGLFLVFINVPGGPLETLRASPWVGRLGQVLDMEQRTSRVRLLIWGGASELVLPHDPLEFPDGDQDTLNFLRPLVGYGPESMHVAYNRFFPPELASIENRNASPDRSHNETWDTMVTTGVLGLGVYLVLFAVIFYYGLKWLGLVGGGRQRNLLLALYFGGGLVTAVAFVVLLGIEFFGVGLPFGAILGLILYLTLRALGTQTLEDTQAPSPARALTLMMLLSAVVAHFVEINFGIAIAATRTYFWVFAGLLLVVGYVLPGLGAYSTEGDAAQAGAVGGRDRRTRGLRRRAGRRAGSGGEPWVRRALVGGVAAGLLLLTLGYDYLNVQNFPNTAPRVVWESLTRLPNRGGAESFGVLALILVLWLAASLVFVAEDGKHDEVKDWRAVPLSLGVSGAIALFYWLWHAGQLLGIARTNTTGGVDVFTQARQFEGLLTGYYLALLFGVFVFAVLLPEDWPVRGSIRSGAVAFAAPVLMIAVLLVGYVTNLRPIQADITFKLADPLPRSGQFDVAVDLFTRSTQLSPGEDHYFLFLGKTYLESAQAAANAAQQQRRVEDAESSLKRAQRLNPLNTDHTANLARMYRWWASQTEDEALKAERSQRATEFYERAVALSPNNVVIWGEWASLYMTNLNDLDQAFEYLSHALELDPGFEATHALLGDYYVRVVRSSDDPATIQENLESAAFHYQQAIENLSNRDQQVRQKQYNYRITLAGVRAELGELEEAVRLYEEAATMAPANAEVWRVQEVIASLYLQLGDPISALAYANNALAGAPAGAKGRLQAFIEQLQATP